MARYRQQKPFNIPLMLLVPTKETIKGVTKKTYPETGDIINCSFSTYGGTEKEVNGVTAVEDTAIIETWYRPDIKGECRIKDQEGNIYEILGKPENIEKRNQYCKFKIRAVGGGA